MFYSYIEYINSNNEITKKEIGLVADATELAEKIFADEYLLEYMYMPEALLILKYEKLTIAKYQIKKIYDKLFLIAR